jgi:uncharacterized membrane protein
MGLRVDTDSTCSHPTNTFLHLANDGIEFTPPNTAIAETMRCGTGQTLTFDQTNFLMLNKNSDSSTVTTYFVSKYSADDSSLGCNDLLGYTVVTFEGGDQPLFVNQKVLAYAGDTSRMMAKIVENIAPAKNSKITRVAETYLHECGHQSGLLHDTDKPDCENDTTLHISKLMNPNGSVRRALTRLQWCLVRTSPYVTSRSIAAFTQAPELPAGTDDMNDGASAPVVMKRIPARPSLVTAIATDVRQREIRRQLAFNGMRKGALAGKNFLASRVSAPFAEFATAMGAALLGAFVLSLLLAAVAGIAPMFTLVALGLMYSAQATYHQYRLHIDPDYKVPRCRCAGGRRDDTETVLRDRASSLAGVPNSVLGILGYLAVLGLVIFHHPAAVLALAAVVALLSAYLGYVMVFRIRALCHTCINLCALNFLILARVTFSLT